MNRLLAYVVTWAIFLFVFLFAVEGGLRLLGLGPQPTINKFDARLGWVKRKDITAERATSEFDVTYRINHLGLRDDNDLTVDKPQNVKRIVLLGDSFTLGYTVDRKDLFVDLLEQMLNKDGRRYGIQVINAGTEGYSTDQELLWLREEGLKFQPDIAVMNFYQNDVYWNGQDHYLRFPKPRFAADGSGDAPERGELEDPGEQGWFTRSTAIGKFLAGMGTRIELFTTPKGKKVPREWGVILKKEPDFIREAWEHTAAVLKGFKRTCEERKIKPLLALIPTKAQVYQEMKELQAAQLGLGDGDWNPNLPFDRIAGICREIGLDYMNPLPLFNREADEGIELYYTRDRHFSPAGNRAFAQALYDRLIQNEYLGQGREAETRIAMGTGSGGSPAPSEGGGLPAWLWVVLVLWAVLGVMYAANYRDENGFLGFLKVGALIWTVVGLIVLLGLLAEALPPNAGGLLFGLVALAVLGFLFWKLRKRVGIIMELYMSFTQRGHWYMMPLLAIMLAIGSLLIVAASSPFVAPFIYTLF